MKKLKDYQMQKFDNLDSLIQNIEVLPSLAGKWNYNQYELPSPIMFEFTNPMARFTCLPENREWAAKSAAESLYAFSGMDGSDFIWEFRGWEDPRVEKNQDHDAIGPSLRFFNRKTPISYDDDILDYAKSNYLRQNKRIDFTDMFDVAISAYKTIKDHGCPGKGITLPIAPPLHSGHPIQQIWFNYDHDEKLNMLVLTGYVNSEDLAFKFVPIFSFLLQVVSDLSGIEMGSVQFVIGCLYSKLKSTKTYNSPPIISIGDFKYPSGGLTLKDLDTLMCIMVEFVSRLDENSLGRANPFEGDDRVRLWNDYAEVFRAWKAEKLGYKVKMKQNFFHPQLRYIYKGEVLC